MVGELHGMLDNFVANPRTQVCGSLVVFWGAHTVFVLVSFSSYKGETSSTIRDLPSSINDVKGELEGYCKDLSSQGDVCGVSTIAVDI